MERLNLYAHVGFGGGLVVAIYRENDKFRKIFEIDNDYSMSHGGYTNEYFSACYDFVRSSIDEVAIGSMIGLLFLLGYNSIVSKKEGINKK